jgi:hypothetical protein
MGDADATALLALPPPPALRRSAAPTRWATPGIRFLSAGEQQQQRQEQQQQQQKQADAGVQAGTHTAAGGQQLGGIGGAAAAKAAAAKAAAAKAAAAKAAAATEAGSPEKTSTSTSTSISSSSSGGGSSSNSGGGSSSSSSSSSGGSSDGGSGPASGGEASGTGTSSLSRGSEHTAGSHSDGGAEKVESGGGGGDEGEGEGDEGGGGDPTEELEFFAVTQRRGVALARYTLDSLDKGMADATHLHLFARQRPWTPALHAAAAALLRPLRALTQRGAERLMRRAVEEEFDPPEFLEGARGAVGEVMRLYGAQVWRTAL